MLSLVTRNFRTNLKWLEKTKFEILHQQAYFVTKQTSDNISKKEQERIKQFVQKYLDKELPDKNLEQNLKHLKDLIKKQAEIVKKLKADKIKNEQLEKAIADLGSYKSKFQNEIIHLLPKPSNFDEKRFNEALTRRSIYNQAFDIYETYSGFYDFGPIGFAIQSNLINEWRHFFVFKEYAHEIDCSIITPEKVLKASGHLDKFSDLMVRDEVTKEAFRVDHLLKNEFEKMIKNSKDKNDRIKSILKSLENNLLKPDEIDEIIEEFNIRSPLTGNTLTKSEQFNLMFQTSVGSYGNIKSYLRPETAQGIFVNFKNLFEFNHKKLPMVIAQVGKSFRNEINPKLGLIRQREFLMAELEHFVDPREKYNKYEKFKNVEDCEVYLLSAQAQVDNKEASRYKLKDAINMGIIKSEIIAFYIGKAYLFVKKCGVNEEKLRFRQHLRDEMAHYADDCWDLECNTSFGWIECAGIADRCDYDLKQHSKYSNEKLIQEKASIRYKCDLDGLKLDQSDVILLNNYFSNLSNEELEKIYKEKLNKRDLKIKIKGKTVLIPNDAIKITESSEERKDNIIPHVIEPSFGIGRIMYTILEHTFQVRPNDNQRSYFSLPPVISPYKCVLLPLICDDKFKNLLQLITDMLIENNISHKIDDFSGSIGKRYAKADEIGIAYAITVDYDSLKEPHTVTIRDRDTTEQIRVKVNEITTILDGLVKGKIIWKDLLIKV